MHLVASTVDTGEARGTRMTAAAVRHRSAFLLLCLLAGAARAVSVGGIDDVDASYRFLVSERAQGGVLYRASAGELSGRMLPLSFYDTASFWGEHVCGFPARSCAVTDVYDSGDYSLQPQKGPAGDLQTERVNIHDGSNVYDAATWQIAVMLGEVRHGFARARNLDAWQLVSNQNLLLSAGYSGNAPHPVAGTNRATTVAQRFTYNGSTITDANAAYAFRMLARRWLADDPLAVAPYEALIQTEGLPAHDRTYARGRVSWTDWKAFTGENAWAFLIGPLQSAYIHHVMGRGSTHVPFNEVAVQSALKVLPTFVAMQSGIGAVYYAPGGTVRNQGEALVDRHEVAVENNASLYAGLNILQYLLQQQQTHGSRLGHGDAEIIRRALREIHVMIHGGRHADGSRTDGLLAFLRQRAWIDGEFVQGGIAGKPQASSDWVPTRHPRAVDANTWTISAVGARQIDDWFGFGASFDAWQRIKRWGGHGRGAALMGVGFSDQDGNGSDDLGHYRAGVLSAEWTAGAINMLRNQIAFYQSVTDAAQVATARRFVSSLQQDETAMLRAVQQLRYDNYLRADFGGRPAHYRQLVPQMNQPYLYADRRYLVPFGWYANPLPSTCATAWMVMLADRFDPLRPAGGAQAEPRASR